jgi:hypothetical protein
VKSGNEGNGAEALVRGNAEEPVTQAGKERRWECEWKIASLSGHFDNWNCGRDVAAGYRREPVGGFRVRKKDSDEGRERRVNCKAEKRTEISGVSQILSAVSLSVCSCR